MPPKRQLLQRQEICKWLEPGQATMTLPEFGKLSPDDGWHVPQLARTGTVTGSAEEQPVA